jgi:hypothetical protein
MARLSVVLALLVLAVCTESPGARADRIEKECQATAEVAFRGVDGLDLQPAVRESASWLAGDGADHGRRLDELGRVVPPGPRAASRGRRS